MKAVRNFMMSIRTALTKDIKKYVSGEDKTEDLDKLLSFLRRTISFCEQNLYVDKPFETALPLFEILKMIQDHFGNYNHHIRVTLILPALGLLEKEELMQSKQLTVFLLNSLKSTWAIVRQSAYDILYHFPKDHSLLNDKEFVNDLIFKSALSWCNNPKAMVSEGSGLLLKLLFNKCLHSLAFIDSSKND
jgi:hypothetical protein